MSGKRANPEFTIHELRMAFKAGAAKKGDQKAYQKLVKELREKKAA